MRKLDGPLPVRTVQVNYEGFAEGNGCSKPHLCKVSNGYSICICLFISRFLPDDCCFSCFRIHTQDLVHFFLPTDVMTGDELVVDGGMVRFEVVEKVGPDVHCRCIDPDYALDV